MLNIDLIIKIKKEFNFSIGESKKMLEKNNWDYNKLIYNLKKNNVRKHSFYNYYSIINVENNNKICIAKVFFNSVILNNSKILEDFKIELSSCILNIKMIIYKVKILSLKLKENIYLSNFLMFTKKNIFFYNHKNSFFCLINYKKKLINICCNVVFNKFNYLMLKKCKNVLINQAYIKDISYNLNQIIEPKFINFIFLMNKHGNYFYYE
ncbi:hypothetical protein [Candidatus Carsonella ruddii]|uniref:Elongation factor EF-Ts n=1 Tax=Candidatus Carsonella ruddii (Diaphorina cf. continua) TaxID=2661587 RepID=A0A7R6VY75_CARRU|nr:hypothetical protein [Candidatus Carsonella ruddii (Diaphorina cf. continua)]BCG49238.1 hypothetical protein CRDco_0200 [Candidatus Carsonella ruddii (Diaphorina cf. continua)]